LRRAGFTEAYDRSLDGIRLRMPCLGSNEAGDRSLEAWIAFARRLHPPQRGLEINLDFGSATLDVGIDRLVDELVERLAEDLLEKLLLLVQRLRGRNVVTLTARDSPTFSMGGIVRRRQRVMSNRRFAINWPRDAGLAPRAADQRPAGASRRPT